PRVADRQDGPQRVRAAVVAAAGRRGDHPVLPATAVADLSPGYCSNKLLTNACHSELARNLASSETRTRASVIPARSLVPRDDSCGATEVGRPLAACAAHCAGPVRPATGRVSATIATPPSLAHAERPRAAQRLAPAQPGCRPARPPPARLRRAAHHVT